MTFREVNQTSIFRFKAGHCALAKADGHRLSSVRIGEFDTSKDPDCAGLCDISKSGLGSSSVDFGIRFSKEILELPLPLELPSLAQN